MLTEPGGPFIQLSRLNISKYANQPSIAKSLFEYIYYHEHDIRYVSKVLFNICNINNYSIIFINYYYIFILINYNTCRH